MSEAAALVAQLAAAGTPPELLAAVAKELFLGEAERQALADRRANERNRKARSRAVTGQDVTDADDAGRVSLDKKAPHTPQKINPIPCVRDAPARGWHRLPEDWQPRPLPAPLQAKVDQWPPGALDDELAGFRRWAANAANTNGKGRKLDWDQAWRNWLARRHDEQHSRKPRNGQQSTPGIGRTEQAAIAALASIERSHASFPD